MGGSIPKWVLWAALGAVILTITGVLFAFFGAVALWFLLISAVVLGLGFAGYRVVGNLLAQRRASPFVQGLSFNAAAAPSGVNDPSQRARLDDLRRRFEEGVETFKSHGKSLYDMPWYLLVGEPGSGKTEAIRHCNVGFPPGLQDQLQGAGGTLNMNWWFTNHAVILDTAGRLMFDQSAQGPSTEWREFLKLLRRHRPNCPINGMLLVIPADSLIRDTTEELEHKGGRIAEQLDLVQRELGVRFPVFAVVTKCDLITGFREFFDGINDPHLQHQMLGWSNPNALDDPFRPEELSEHLSVVRERLKQRRNGLMLEVANSGEGDRIAKLESLYAFPEAMMRIAPRLRRYLELIFVSGEWATKPLFLRGIYFNSSMREGAALDEDLAQALGMSVDTMPGGKIWEKDKAYFLRDLFMGKVFQERGLVTNAGNAKQQQRGRRLVVLGSGVAAAVVLIAATIFSSVGFKQSLGEPQAFWSSASEQLGIDNPESTHVVGKKFADRETYEYRGGRTLSFGSPPPTLAQMPAQAINRLEESSLSPPVVFAPVAWVSGDPESLRRPAIRGVFESTTLKPVLDAVRGKLASTGSDSWSPEATAVLAELLAIEASFDRGRATVDNGAPIKISSMLGYLLDEEEFAKYEGEDRDAIERVAAWAYSNDGGGLWPPPAATTGSDVRRAELSKFVRTFVESTVDSLGTEGGQYRTVLSLRERLEEFGVAEVRLQGLRQEFGEIRTATQYAEFRDQWSIVMSELTEAHDELLVLIERLGLGAELSIADLIADSRVDALEGPRASFDLLREAFGEAEGEGEEGSELAAALDRGWERVGELADEELEAAEEDLRRRKERLLDAGARGGERRFAQRYRVYAAADEWMAMDPGSPAPGKVRETLRDLRTRSRTAQDEIERITGASSGLAVFAEAQEAAMHALRAAMRAQYAGVVRARVNDAPFNPASLGEEIAARAESLDPIEKPVIPLSGLGVDPFDPVYHPEAAGAVMNDWVAVGELLREQVEDAGEAGLIGGDQLLEEYEDLDADVFGRYAEGYLRYWGSGVLDDGSFDRRQITTWGEFHERIARLEPRDVNRKLRDFYATVLDALDQVPGALVSESERESVLGTVRAEVDLLEQRDFAADAEEAVIAWAELPSDPRAARRTLLGLSAVRFERTYLSVYGESASAPGVRYWNELLFAGLDTLAAASRNESRDLLETLIEDYKAFPLCLTDERELSGPELRRAIDLLASLSRASADEGTAEEGTLGGGRSTRFDRVNEALLSLLGDDLFGGSMGDWFRGVAALGEGLAGLNGATIEVLLPTAQEESPSIPGEVNPIRAYPNFRFLRLGSGGPGGTVFAADVQGPVEPRLAIPTEGGVSLGFLRNQAADASATIGGDSRWTVLRWLSSPGASRDLEDPKLWRVPLLFKDADGRARYYWIGIRVDAELPTPSEWPASGDWPGGLP